MSEWTTAAREMVTLLLGGHTSVITLSVIAVLAIAAAMFALAKAGSAFGIANTGFFYSLVTLVLGVVLVVAAMVAVKLYLPMWENESIRVWLLVGAGLIVSLVIVAPLMCAIQRAKYGAALMTWLCGVIAAGVVIAVVGGVINGFISGPRARPRAKSARTRSTG